MAEKKSVLSVRQNQILEELRKSHDEISGQQLHRALQDGPSNMGLTTVYRNLRGLQQKGLVRCRNLPNGEVLYAPVDRDHHHLTCVDCGQTIPLEYCPIDHIDLPIEETNNFQILFHTLEFFGLCQDCLLKKKNT